jgi:hypothetical protein
MRGDIACRRGVAVSQQSSSLCLRYDYARPSVWLRNSVRKLGRFNNFHSDYPLNFSCTCLGRFTVFENLLGCRFLFASSEVLDWRAVVASRLELQARIVSCLCNDVAFGPMIGQGVGVSTSRFYWSPDALCIGLRDHSLNLQIQFWLTNGMLSSLARARAADSDNNASVVLHCLTQPPGKGANYARDRVHECGH